eukprot:8922077-Pyramimonas_sp.AAC.2
MEPAPTPLPRSMTQPPLFQTWDPCRSHAPERWRDAWRAWAGKAAAAHALMFMLSWSPAVLEDKAPICCNAAAIAA